MSVFKNIFLVIVNPQMGWDEVNLAGHNTQKVQQTGFYPMLALLAIASFIPMLYDPAEVTLSVSLIHAIAEFASYFATFFLASYLLGGFYPEIAKTHSAVVRLNNFIIYNLIYLVLLEILNNALDNDFPPVYFLLLYTPVIVSKGLEYIGLKDEKKTAKFVIVSSLVFIVSPIILRSILEFMIK